MLDHQKNPLMRTDVKRREIWEWSDHTPLEQVQFVDGMMVLKYELTKGLEAKVPYYLMFNKDTRQLESWLVQEGEYAQNKDQNSAAWMNLSNTLQQQQMLQQPLNTPQTLI
jgi:hypothetical protein